jgi:hypothetical protein
MPHHTHSPHGVPSSTPPHEHQAQSTSIITSQVKLQVKVLLLLIFWGKKKQGFG